MSSLPPFRRAEAISSRPTTRAESTPDEGSQRRSGILCVDETGRITYVNRAGAALLRSGRNDLRGRNLHPSLHVRPDGEPCTENGCPILRSLRGGEEVHVEDGLFRRPDGSPVSTAYVSGPIRADGRIEGAVITFEDTAEPERTEEAWAALIESEREARAEAERRAGEEAALRRATSAVNEAFTIDDVIHRIAESALDACRADASVVARIDVEKNEIELIAAAGGELEAEGIRFSFEDSLTREVVERGEPRTVPTLHEAAKEGRPLAPELLEAWGDCSAVIVPLVDSGEAIGSLALLRRPERPPYRPDEIERAHTFGRLAALALRKVHLLEDSERKREELQDVMESRDRLVRGFTHDVRNPLNAADGRLQLLEEGILGELGEVERKEIGRVRQSVHEAVCLIDDLVELARTETGNIEIHWEPVEVREAAMDLVGEYRPRAERKGLSLEFDLPSELPVIRSDAPRIRQVLGNLLSNAIEYTDDGEIEVRVEVRDAGPDSGFGECLALQVSDTGPGIPEDQLPYVFREFSRVVPVEREKERTTGSGIGLAISRSVAEAIGGRLTAESRVGRGSTFTLWLPRS